MTLKKISLLAAFLLLFAEFSFSLTVKEEDAIFRDFVWNSFIALPKNERPKIGVTLSAGGVRGFSHIGTMEVLSESGIPVDYMSGTSMGCIVGSLYAAGVPISRMWELAYNPDIGYLSKDISLVGVFKFLFGSKLFSSEHFQSFISQEVGGLNYENLKIPMACVSADIKTGEKVIFDSGPVALGVRASMNLPGIFAPVEYRQRYLVDGGVVDYMPVDLVKEMGADWVLAIYALPDYSKSVPTTILGYVVRTGDIRGAVITEYSERSANFVVGSRVGDISFVNPKETVRAVEIGAKTTYKALDAMKDDLLLYSIDYVFK